mgnify:CR=1 FL=1
MKTGIPLVLLVASLALTACAAPQGVSQEVPEVSSSNTRYVGILAVEESARVWQIIDASGNDPAIYGMELVRALDRGEPGVRPATGTFGMAAYDGGRPTGAPVPVTLSQRDGGRWWLPTDTNTVRPGMAICVQVPESWPAIAGQRLYPVAGGFRVNCYDFGPEAAEPGFASSVSQTARVVVIKPAG